MLCFFHGCWSQTTLRSQINNRKGELGEWCKTDECNGGIQINTIKLCSSNGGLMLGQRRRQGSTLNQHWISWVISKRREYPYAIGMWSLKPRGIHYSICMWSLKPWGILYSICMWSLKPRGITYSICMRSLKPWGIPYSICMWSLKPWGISYSICMWSLKPWGIPYSICM